MFNLIIQFLLLLGTWLVLSGFFKGFFIALGVLSCLISVFIAYKIRNKNDSTNYLAVMLRSVSYFLWLIKEIAVSSYSVAIKMWQLEPEISPEIAWIQSSHKDDLGLTIYGNSITLTPGTVTTGVREDGMVQVHALNKEGLDDLRGGQMNKKVLKVTGTV